jgi:DNA-binding IclR family transcriptional regulator
MAAIKTPLVPALDRGLTILEMVSKSRSGLTFSQLARRLDFPKSSIHSILVTFERLGYLHRSETTGRYACGMKLAEIANMAFDGTGMREKASPLLRSLSERTGLTVHLAILEGQEATLIAKAATVAGQHVATWAGKRLDVHCTSLGKCLIAYLEEPQIDEIIRRRGLLRHNENTIRSARKLKEDLERTRARGFALDDQEEEIGMRCVGAPVFNADGRVIAAVSLSATVEQIGPENQKELITELQHTAVAISDRLGWTGQPRVPVLSEIRV